MSSFFSVAELEKMKRALETLMANSEQKVSVCLLEIFYNFY